MTERKKKPSKDMGGLSVKSEIKKEDSSTSENNERQFLWVIMQQHACFGMYRGEREQREHHCVVKEQRLEVSKMPIIVPKERKEGRNQTLCGTRKSGTFREKKNPYHFMSLISNTVHILTITSLRI